MNPDAENVAPVSATTPEPASATKRTDRQQQQQQQQQQQPMSGSGLRTRDTNTSPSRPAPEVDPSPSQGRATTAIQAHEEQSQSQERQPQPQQEEQEQEQEQELGPRALRFRATFSAALSRTIAALSFPSFGACFPTPATHRPATLHAFWDHFRTRLGQVCLSEFDAIVADRHVFGSLNALDGLVGEAKSARAAAVVRAEDGDVPTPVVPHTLPPDRILDAHLRPHLRASHAALSAELARSRLATVELAKRIRVQRSQMVDTVASLDRVVADIKAAVGGDDGDDGDDGRGNEHNGTDDRGDDHGDEARKRRKVDSAGLSALGRLEVDTVQMEELVTAMSRD